jgi:hypothetical protein
VQILDDLHEVVVQGVSRRVKRFAKTLSPAYLEQDIQRWSRFRRPTLAGTVSHGEVMGMQNAAKQRGIREYLVVNGQMERKKGHVTLTCARCK